MDTAVLNYKYDSSLFSNTFGFLRCPLNFNPYSSDSDWIVTGIPFDMATSGRSGSRFGPMSIRQASINLDWEDCRWPWNFDIRDNLKIIDCGDLIYKFGDVQNFTEVLQTHVQKLLGCGKKMLSLGGDHYVTLPILREYAKKFNNIAIIHFDAHADYFDNDNKYDHGAIIFHAINEKLINPINSVQIGVRTKYIKNSQFTVLDADYIHETNYNVIINKIISVVQSSPVYLTFDIDCLDPSVAPGTGTPVIGGMTSYCALRLIRGLNKLNIVGFDIVEVAPSYDCAQITALAAATLGLEMLYTRMRYIK